MQVCRQRPTLNYLIQKWLEFHRLSCNIHLSKQALSCSRNLNNLAIKKLYVFEPVTYS